MKYILSLPRRGIKQYTDWLSRELVVEIKVNGGKKGRNHGKIKEWKCEIKEKEWMKEWNQGKRMNERVKSREKNNERVKSRKKEGMKV